MRKEIKIALFIIAIGFIGYKLIQYPENQDIKRISEIYYSGDYEKSKDELLSFTNKNPKSYKGWTFLGHVYLDLNDTINAEKAYIRGLELNQKNDKAMVGLGIIARMRKQYEEAERRYQEALIINPTNADAYSSLLVIEIHRKNYSKAVELGEKARRLNIIEQRNGILGNLALAYHLNNQFEERDKIINELQEKGYQDLKYLKMMINGEIALEDFL